MALPSVLLYRTCNYLFLRNLTKQLSNNVENKYFLPKINGFRYSHSFVKPVNCIKRVNYTAFTVRSCSNHNAGTNKMPSQPDEKKPGLFQRFKEMYRQYWYVLVPVHLATSAVWVGSFYYAVRSGVDIHGFLLSMGISEKILAPLKDSSAGYIALTYALYKVATPLRYAVTLGGTTYAINKLKAVGWIKPVPSRERIKEMIQERKDNIQDRFTESRQHYQTQLQEKKTKVVDEMNRYKTEIRSIKDKVKKM